MSKAIWLLLISIGLVGCASLDEDFGKATLVSDVELGRAGVYTKPLRPPSGAARLIIAIPNYRCAPVSDGPISIAVRSDGGITVYQNRIRLSEMTWSYGRDSCDAYGYVDSSSGRVSARFEIKEHQGSLHFDIDVSQAGISSKRPARIWLIYGDRVPGEKIFDVRHNRG